MPENNFFSKIQTAARKNSSWLCVGLDPQFFYLPEQFKSLPSPEAVLKFNLAIIAATAPYVCAFKPNLAYFEVLGGLGLEILKKTIEAIPPEIPVILDGKRADVGHSAAFYAQAAYEYLGVDAVTANPYLGYDALEPFLKNKDKGVFILCLTSNPGAADLQKLMVSPEASPAGSTSAAGQVQPLFAQVAKKVSDDWNKNKNCGLVVGATAAPADWQKIKSAAPDLPWLIPGLGAQGGELENLVRAVDQKASSAGQSKEAKGSTNNSGPTWPSLIFNVSRSIISASSGDDFTIAAAREAKSWRDRINGVML